ncbi:hypothetical protein ACFOLA_07780 [Salinicoccus hispanicus]|uniref:DoxX family membrane protein n=1 Tax=Salinicoccus hispanicus TaxID=157225 RepID=A0A6N8U0Q5_9STAP|nr:hypothetical protein [Salinicoccus hispanicus]MXQ51654.1 hypothetical protein [Salinicoccus hispanicus]
MIHYLLNAFIGKNIIESGLTKVENEGQVGEDFEKEFNVNPNQMKIAGYFEAIGAMFLFASFLGKAFTRIGSLMVGSVMGVAAYKHYKAGHGYEGSKNALKFLGLSTLSFANTFNKK